MIKKGNMDNIKESQFETDIRNFFINIIKDHKIKEQLENALLIKREWTRVGFYLKYKLKNKQLLISKKKSSN